MMHFQTYNHLDSDNNFSESETINFETIKDMNNYECIICLEKNSVKFVITKLSNALFINKQKMPLEKTCECECFIHKICLNKWVKKCESCPICREKFNENINPIDDQTIHILAQSYNQTCFCFEISKFLKNLFTGLYVFILLTFIYNVSNFVIIIVNKNI